MNALLVGILLMMAAHGAHCNCDFGSLRNVVQRTQSLITHRIPFVVPQDPLGTHYPSACVGLTFKIDGNGQPVDIQIVHSSRNRVIDVAARETLRHYRFELPNNDTKDNIFALSFYYKGRE